MATQKVKSLKLDTKSPRLKDDDKKAGGQEGKLISPSLFKGGNSIFPSGASVKNLVP